MLESVQSSPVEWVDSGRHKIPSSQRMTDPAVQGEGSCPAATVSNERASREGGEEEQVWKRMGKDMLSSKNSMKDSHTGS